MTYFGTRLVPISTLDVVVLLIGPSQVAEAEACAFYTEKILACVNFFYLLLLLVFYVLKIAHALVGLLFWLD
jgi:hypothetical protein